MVSRSSIQAPTPGELVKEEREKKGWTRTQLARAIDEGGRYGGKYTNFINLTDQLMWAERDSRELMGIALDVLARAEATPKPPKADTTKKQPAAAKPKAAKGTKAGKRVARKSPAQEIALAVAERIETEAVEAATVSAS